MLNNSFFKLFCEQINIKMKINIIKKVMPVCFLILFSISAIAQKEAPKNWFNLDFKTDKVHGISTEKAYKELLKDKKSKPVIVAVIDGGTEVNHEDLKDVMWVNEKEVAGNNLDDDKNGFIDDVNGWNFIGGKDASVVEDNLEITRVYAKLKEKFDGLNEASILPADKSEYELYKKVSQTYQKKYKNAQRMSLVYDELAESISKIKDFVKTSTPSKEQLKSFKPSSQMDAVALKEVNAVVKNKKSIDDLLANINEGKAYFKSQLDFHLNLTFNSRKIIGDDYNNLSDMNYGNNRVSGPKGDHGTHVAGIIAAVRNNKFGIEGVSSNTQIMVLRAVPDGDERDKDVANAIRYAVNNGARVINMSFGKSFSPNKTYVDDAIRYAIEKDVLIIHAAGNDHSNIDTVENFPTAQFLNEKTKASNWIEVGASTWMKKKNLTAPFSNFGKNTVDVFAPGYDIYSCIPESKYTDMSGTSMAAPVVAGLAAVLRSYFPTITAQQTKELILQSSIKYDKKVFIPGTKTKVLLSDISVTGGIANLYEAVKLGIEKGYLKY